MTYRPRTNVRALALQYFLYGRWRRAVARQHAGTINLRYLAPPATLLVLLIGTLAGLAGVASLADRTGTWWQWLLTAGLGVPLTYVIGLFVVTARAGTDGRLSGRAVAWLPAVLATMHLCWGAGFLTSPRRLVRARESQRGSLAPSGPQPSGLQSDGPQRDGPQPSGPQPDGPQPDGPQPDGPQPGGPQPDGPQRDNRAAQS